MIILEDSHSILLYRLLYLKDDVIKQVSNITKTFGQLIYYHPISGRLKYPSGHRIAVENMTRSKSKTFSKHFDSFFP